MTKAPPPEAASSGSFEEMGGRTGFVRGCGRQARLFRKRGSALARAAPSPEGQDQATLRRTGAFASFGERESRKGGSMERVEAGGLQVAKILHDFLVAEALPGTGIAAEAFWDGLG